MQGITFRVSCPNRGSINELRIEPEGLLTDNSPMVQDVDGTVVGAEVADLNADGSPEVYVYVQSAGSGSYGSLVAFSANNLKSLSGIYLPPVAEHPQASKGYMGHDVFAVVGDRLVQRFPLYGNTDANATPTGGTRQVSYRLEPGEAGWLLRVDRIVDRVAFKPGASSATLSGTIKGDESIDYVLDARSGQTMSVSLETSNASSYFNVLPPGSEAAIAIGSTTGNTWSGAMPADGDYRIRVYLMRNAARRNESATFTLTVGMTGSARGGTASAGGVRGDAKVAGTAYHATGKVPCSVGPDAKGSAQCSFGVIRRGNGQAELYLADPGFDVTLDKDQSRVLQFAGERVTSANASEKVTATRSGDEWSVTVNDFYYYTIPIAVIAGG